MQCSEHVLLHTDSGVSWGGKWLGLGIKERVDELEGELGDDWRWCCCCCDCWCRIGHEGGS